MTDTLDLDAIERRVNDCRTYKFGMFNADLLAHDDAPALLAEVRRLRAENAALQETEWQYGFESQDGTVNVTLSKDADDARRRRPLTTNLVRRRKAGPWIPAPEGTTDD